MADFMDLPDEIQLLLIQHVDPEDVMSFSCVCKKIRHLSKDRIQRHLELQEIYSEIHIDEHHHPLTLLYAIRKNPEIARYVKYVQWHGTQDPLAQLPAGPLYYGHGKEAIPVGPWNPDEITAFMPDLRPAIMHLGPYAISWELFRDRLQKGRSNACFLLLLFHLPRLTRLRFTAPTFDTSFYLIALTAWSLSFDPKVDLEFNRHLLTGRFLIGGKPRQYNYPLSPPSIKIVEGYDNSSEQTRFDFSPLTSFAGLSSVHTIRVKDAGDGTRHSNLPWEFELNPQSTVDDISGDESDTPPDDDDARDRRARSLIPFKLRSLELADSDIPISKLRQVLMRCQNLTSFKMSYATDPTDFSRWHDFLPLYHILERHFADKLTQLSLVHPFDYGATAQVPSFKPFAHLRWLEISLATLLPHDTWRAKEAYLMDGGAMPRLLDVLPDTVEELVLGIEIATTSLTHQKLLDGWPYVPGGFPSDGQSSSDEEWCATASAAKRLKRSDSPRHHHDADLSAFDDVSLPSSLARITYFCCTTTIVQCECVDPATLLDYEDGAYVGLDIGRKKMRGWMPQHAEVWEDEPGLWDWERGSPRSDESGSM